MVTPTHLVQNNSNNPKIVSSVYSFSVIVQWSAFMKNSMAVQQDSYTNLGNQQYSYVYCFVYKKAVNVFLEYSLKCKGVSFYFAFYFIKNPISTEDSCTKAINIH